MEGRRVVREIRQNFSPSNIADVVRQDLVSSDRQKSKIARFLVLLRHIARKSKNPWYYWYTGSKLIAVQAWIVSFLIMFTVVAISSGGSLVLTFFYVLVGVALESLAIVILVMVLLADYYILIPDVFYRYLIFPLLVSAFFAFVVNRSSVFIILHSRSADKREH